MVYRIRFDDMKYVHDKEKVVIYCPELFSSAKWNKKLLSIGRFIQSVNHTVKSNVPEFEKNRNNITSTGEYVNIRFWWKFHVSMIISCT